MCESTAFLSAMRLRLRGVISLFCLGFTLGGATTQAQIAGVAASDRTIDIHLEEHAPEMLSVFAAAVYEADAAAIERGAVSSGMRTGSTITLPRFDGSVDRLYQRFLVADSAGRMLGASQYVTDLTEVTRDAAALPQPSSPKGLQCIVDLDDAIDLGVKHAAVNVSFAQLYDASEASLIRRDVDGVIVAVREPVVAALDATVKRLTDAGVRVTLILLNYQQPSSQAASSQSASLRHPATDDHAPNGIGAFNLTDDDGVRAYRGLIELLAERYSRPDARYGLVANYIVGNEVQSHYDWYNLGDADPDAVIADYANAVRIADLAVRRFHPDARVFVSLDHNWMRQHRPQPTRSMPGRTLLDGLHVILAMHGDVPWGVAFHPYPEDLGDPRTWQDETALPGFETPRITFKNLEVLTAYLRQPRLLFDSEPRRLILSEQGFHCRVTDDGETLQAAAYAYAFERVRRIDGIESFIYHRHVDHPHEGGLRLGLRETPLQSAGDATGERPIVDVFRAIDTPEGSSATAFALPIVGIDSWEAVRPVDESRD